jgi:hypothetical protein
MVAEAILPGRQTRSILAGFQKCFNELVSPPLHGNVDVDYCSASYFRAIQPKAAVAVVTTLLLLIYPYHDQLSAQFIGTMPKSNFFLVKSPNYQEFPLLPSFNALT